MPTAEPMYQVLVALLRMPPEPIVRVFVAEMLTVPTATAEVASALTVTSVLTVEAEVVILMFCVELLVLERTLDA